MKKDKTEGEVTGKEKSLQNLKPFKKGDVRINRKGRPKKYVSLLKSEGYKVSEINDTIQILLQMNEEELEEVLDNDNANILEKTISKALLRSLKSGSLFNLETLFTRVYGSPKQEIKHEVEIQPPLYPDLNNE